ncbi:MAG TPA: DNA gyrase inhibitor YacG [Gammaproteobacteria bacterium]|nr:DNA gyrase inhibitor YacG [Gammaproteobacteria bacterium]
MSDTTRILNCPTCKKSVVWSNSNPHRPFCSARCQLIDLGAWADESHRIPGDPNDPAASDDFTL